jgi:hypothetical protein
MIIETLKAIFSRDLKKLKSEIEAYQNETRIWQVEKAISNSAGNLCLHVTGSLNAYIGVGLAKTNYIRNRDLEFSLKDIPKAELVKKIEETMLVVEKGLNNLPVDQLKEDFPVVVWDKATEMEYTLVHFIGHLNYHLGQINYHRRLLDSK